ncbi:MAG: hypothetical protein AAF351_15450, partial [Pseudomonadota bacterium]
MTISTRNLAALTNAPALEQLLKAYALLDAILCPEWEYRYYSFDQLWADGERMGSMRNGQGDHFFALFTDSGCFLKGFDHESPMSPWTRTNDTLCEGLFDGVPQCFAAAASEPAFDIPNTTFCIWQENSAEQWQHADIDFAEGSDPDGSEWLLSMLDGKPQTYVSWATDYYEIEIATEPVAQILSGGALSPDLVNKLNAKRTIGELADD